MQQIKKWGQSAFTLYFIAILLGILSGLSMNPHLTQVAQLLSEIFIKIFRCISLPLIALSIVVTISTMNTTGKMKHLWQRTVLYTFSTTVVAAFVSALLYYFIKPGNVNLDDFNPSTPFTPALGEQLPAGSYIDHILNLIPGNILEPFLEHQVMGVLLVGIVTGIAIRYIPEDAPRAYVCDFFRGIHSLFLVITKWVVKAIPLGLFGFITITVVELQKGVDISGLGEYLAIVVLANLIQGFIVLPIWLKCNGLAPFSIMRKMLPALSIAFFSKSSAGTLPITMENAEKKLNMNPTVSRFVLPFCTSINMNGCAAFIFATVIYLMQNHGTQITPSLMLIWVLVSTIAAIGNAGIPMGCFFLSASLLTSMNVPIVLLGLILPFYSLIDMVETSLNVWSDSCVAVMVDNKTKDLS